MVRDAVQGRETFIPHNISETYAKDRQQNQLSANRPQREGSSIARMLFSATSQRAESVQRRSSKEFNFQKSLASEK
jgi:hypothetical protein